MNRICKNFDFISSQMSDSTGLECFSNLNFVPAVRKMTMRLRRKFRYAVLFPVQCETSFDCFTRKDF
ncbi:MAG: hypothetical protein DWH80_14725 [Planctomycetota bacterium]|nr:MAG: hypothetical protein DWH80_14725 [Planctomycetota bacterium]